MIRAPTSRVGGPFPTGALFGWLAVLATTVPVPGLAQSRISLPRHEVAFYLAEHGEVRPEEDAGAALAHRVFSRVRAVADKSHRRLPQLVVVGGRADPWAIALPDGHIVLSRGAVALCLEHVEAAEACLAFVLGHELAHLANDDFWHEEVYRFLSVRGRGPVLDSLDKARGVRERELAADDRGYVFATLAGYPVDRLLAVPGRGAGFFAAWMEQASARVDPSYPAADERVRLLEGRLADIQERVALFDFAVRLSHFDYCDDAVHFLREFQKVFAGREVLNNLGFCHLQMARQAMAAERAYLYWMPLVLDGQTRAPDLAGRGGRALRSLRDPRRGAATRHLERAVEYLALAARADPGYLPARLNLAVAQLYLGRPHRARAELAEALDLDPTNRDALELDAIALHEQSGDGADLWSAAFARLDELSQRSGQPARARFNLARLRELREGHGAARTAWNRLARRVAELPAPIAAIVCSEQDAVAPSDCRKRAKPRRMRAPWRWPLAVDGLVRLAPAHSSALAGWSTLGFDWQRDRLYGRIHTSPTGDASVLELDGFVQLQVLRGRHLGAEAELARHCPQSPRTRRLARGEVHSCGSWAALVADGRVLEAWWTPR